MANVKEFSVEEKLASLVTLQKIESKLDEIHILKGELPMDRQAVQVKLGEGDWQPAQRPSWNYRSEEGGGIILDMLCHWRYVLDNLFGAVQAVICLGATHIPSRVDEDGAQATLPSWV